MKNKINIKSVTDDLINKVEVGVKSLTMPKFVPSGVQDFDIIKVIAENAQKGRTLILNIQCNNKQGKTAAAAAILRNSFWEHDPDYFDYPIFRDWPFTDDTYDKNGKLINIGKPIKRFRVIGTSKNIEDSGPIKAEINKWWPAGRYTKQKAGKTYYREYETDTEWFGDFMSFEQEPKEFEGPLISLTWIDEPAKGQLMGPICSRHSKGGLILITQTPIGAGPMLDVLDDLKEKGAKVVNIYSDIYENSVKSGKLNSKGKKRGLMTDQEIKNFISIIPLDERPARIFGQHVGKSGKVLYNYDDMNCVRHFELDSEFAKSWNCYCIIDPHDKYYPFLLWIAQAQVNGKTKHIIYNEWPTQRALSNYYDEVRTSLECKLGPKEISQIIKILDGSEYGLSISGRVIDPMFEKNTRSNWSKKTDGIVLEYQRFGINWELPKPKLVQAQISHINELLKTDQDQPPGIYNEPDIFVMPHCHNIRRAMMRHYWDAGKESESDQYRCPIECLKMYFAFIKNRPYRPNAPQKAKEPEMKITKFIEKYTEGMKDIRL